MTKRPGHKRFEKKVVKAMTTEMNNNLWDSFRLMGGDIVEFEYTGNDLDSILVSVIHLSLRVAIRDMAERFDPKTMKLDTTIPTKFGWCKMRCTPILEPTNSMENAFPLPNTTSPRILFTYSMNINGKFVKIKIQTHMCLQPDIKHKIHIISKEDEDISIELEKKMIEQENYIDQNYIDEMYKEECD